MRGTPPIRQKEYIFFHYGRGLDQAPIVQTGSVGRRRENGSYG